MNKHRTIYRERFFWIASILAVAGLLLVIVAQTITNNAFWQSTVNNIASALLITGVFSFINEYLLKNKLVDMVFEKLQLKESLSKTGVEDILFGIDDIDYSYYIKKATRNIDIVHVYGRTWTNNLRDDFVDKLLNSNCAIRVVLVSPDSEFIPALAVQFGKTEDQLKQDIEQVKKAWADIYSKLEAKRPKKGRRTQSSLKLYFHNGFPANSIYRFDNEIIFVSTKLNKGKTKKLPSIICQDTSKKEDLFNIYKEQVELLITEDSREENLK